MFLLIVVFQQDDFAYAGMPFAAYSISKNYFIELSSQERVIFNGDDSEVMNNFFGPRNAVYNQWLISTVQKVDAILSAIEWQEFVLLEYRDS